MNINLDIPLNPKQVEMYNRLNDDKYNECLFYGSSRSGKTFLILFWMISQSVIRKANCLILRNVLTSLQTGMIRQTLPAVLKSIASHNGLNKVEDLVAPNGKRFCVYDKKENILRFFNGAYIQFGAIRGSSDVSSTYDKILSTEWGHIFVDECSEVDELAIDTLRTRLAQKLDVTNKMIYALNPTTKSHWTYVRFFKRENREGLKLEPAVTDRFLVVHFSVLDNREYLSADYVNTLSQLSALQRKRFLSGEYSDESEGEIFDHIPWGPVPSQLFDCLIYTDPSAKDNESCDYKASVLLASAADKIYLLGVKAVKGTSLQMMYNIFELFKMSPVPPRIIMVAQAEGQDTPTEGGLSEDTITCCTNFESALETLFGEGIRAVGILDAAVVSGISDLPDVSEYNAPRVALQIVTSTKTRNASVGRSGGIVSARNLATSIGNVSMGSVTTADYLVDSASNAPVNTPVTLLTRTQTNDLCSETKGSDRKPNKHLVTYYDTLAEGWRSFRMFNLVKIV